MWELDYKESWAPPKNWCFWTVVLEKTLKGPLDCKEIKSVHPKGNQSWLFIGRTDAEAKAPIFWPPNMKSQLTGKDPDAGKDGRQEEKGTTEDEMVGWHHWLDGHDFEQAPGIGDGQVGWRAAVHTVAKSRTRLSDWTELIVLFGGSSSDLIWLLEGYKVLVPSTLCDKFRVAYWWRTVMTIPMKMISPSTASTILNLELNMFLALQTISICPQTACGK